MLFHQLNFPSEKFMFRRLPLPIVLLLVLAVVLATMNLWEDRSQHQKKSLLWNPHVGMSARIIAAEQWAGEGPAGLQELLKALHSSDRQIRTAAIVGLGRFGPGAAESFPELVAGLTDPYVLMRREAIGALASIETDKSLAAAHIAPMFCDEDTDVRLTALRHLRTMGRAAVPAVVDLLHQADCSAGQCLAIQLLEQIGREPDESTDEIRRVLQKRSVSPEVRETALLSLLTLKAASLEEIADSLKLSRQEIVVRGMQQSAAFPADARLDALIVARLDDASPPIRRAARVAVQQRSQVPGETVGRLEAVVPRAPATESLEIARLLNRLDPHNAAAVAALKRLAADPDSILAPPAAAELRSCPTGALVETIRELAAQAEQGPIERRIRTLEVLAALGKHSRDAIPALISCLDDESIRRAVHTSQSPSDRRDEEMQLRLAALQVLQNVGDEAAAAVPSLVRLLHSDALRDESAVRVEAIEALGCIGPAAEHSIPLLREIAGRQEQRARRTDSPAVWLQQVHAVAALRRLQQDVPSAVPDVLAAASRNNPIPQALLALPRIGAPPEAAVPVLRRVLKSANEYQRYAACTALGEYGPGAAVAAPELATLLQGPDPRLQRAAIHTLQHIGPLAQPAVPSLVAFAVTTMSVSNTRAIAPDGPVRTRPGYYDFGRLPRESVRESEIWAAVEAIVPEAVDELRRDAGTRGAGAIP
jgi:hypothetical protein